tara:strand:+ start:394 stop:858 length:465 start_codon:yes stop_codon:yes gene_type:complete
MKKLLTSITILILVACQPSELDRCIEANIEYDNPQLINSYLISSDLDIVTNSDLKKQWIKSWNEIITYMYGYDDQYEDMVKKGRFENSEFNKETGLFRYSVTVGDLYAEHEYKEEYMDENYERHANYNREFYGLTDQFIYKEIAESICHAQGIY